MKIDPSSRPQAQTAPAVQPTRIALAQTLVLASCLLAFPACIRSPGAGAEDAEAQPTEISQSEVQELEALGYVDFAPQTEQQAEEQTEQPASGVVLRGPGCDCTGYTLLTYPGLGRAELIDSQGRVVHEWAQEWHQWERAGFGDNGDLLVVGLEPDGKGDRQQILLRLDFEGRQVWKQVLRAHHRVETLPEGRLATLISRTRELPDRFGSEPRIDNGIVLLSPDGTVEQERSLYDMLTARPDIFEFLPRKDAYGQSGRDLLHANHLDWMPGGDLAERDPLYAASNVLVSFRLQDTVAVFDFERGEVIWAWGQGDVVGCHEAGVLRNGHFLLFDNRARGELPESGDGWSRVIEIDPLTRRIVWEYRADPPEQFYSHSRGTAQRLAGGNTLIGSSNQGRVFEVTPEGDIVWEYRTPYENDKGMRAVFRAERYGAEFIEPLLKRRSPS